MVSKKWYSSKVMWVNAIALVGAFVSRQYGFEMSAEEVAGALAVINMFLRAITKQPLG